MALEWLGVRIGLVQSMQVVHRWTKEVVEEGLRLSHPEHLLPDHGFQFHCQKCHMKSGDLVESKSDGATPVLAQQVVAVVQQQ